MKLIKVNTFKDVAPIVGNCVICTKVREGLVTNRFNYEGEGEGKSFLLYICPKCFDTKIKDKPVDSLETLVALLKIKREVNMGAIYFGVRAYSIRYVP